MTSRPALDVRRFKSSLVATFSRANPPLIWRFDLERNHSFTLAMQGDEHEWELGVTSPKGEFHPVAHFANRDDADAAFAAVSAALSRRGNKKWLLLPLKIIAALVVMYVLALLALSFIQPLSSPLPTPMSSEEGGGAGPSPTVEGVPMPADQALKPPQP